MVDYKTHGYKAGGYWSVPIEVQPSSWITSRNTHSGIGVPHVLRTGNEYIMLAVDANGQPAIDDKITCKAWRTLR
jgi:hypothetical protein